MDYSTKRCYNIAIIIPVHNRRETTIKCIENLLLIRKTDDYKATIIVVDDGSTDNTYDAISTNYQDVILLRGSGNLWWTGAINLGISYATIEDKYEYILTLNDDIDFKADFIKILLKSSLAKPKSIVGAITVFSHNKKIIWKAGMEDTNKIHPLFKNIFQNINLNNPIPELVYVDVVSGRAMLIPVKLLKNHGYFNQNRFPHGYADHEFCIRAKKHGYKLIINTKSVIYSKPGTNKSFFYLLNTLPIKEQFKTFFDKKYDWHLKSLIFIYLNSRNYLKGLTGFSIHVLILIKWVVLKCFLPSNSFSRIVIKKYND